MSLRYGTAQSDSPSLAVIGGGLAGIAAAEAATRRGYRVVLFERSRVLGGRAASLFDPVSDQWIDNGQHLAMGCCTELLALHERFDLQRFFECRQTIPFSQTDGKRWTIAASPFFPAGLKLLPALLRLPFLPFNERLRMGKLVRKLTTERNETDEKCFADWLATERASPESIDKFWTPLILSSLGETPEHVSCQAVRKVIKDGFLAGREAMSVLIPTRPLRSIYHDAVGEKLRKAGVELNLLSRIRKLSWEFQNETGNETEEKLPQVTSLELADGSRHAFDAYILAVPAYRTWEILDASDLASYADQLGLDRFEPGAITTIHLWFDRRLLPAGQVHTALLGGPGQFLFCPDRTDRKTTDPKKVDGVYHTVVISASHRLLSDSELTAAGSTTLVERVLEQLRKTFPKALLKTFSKNTAEAPFGNDKEETQLLHHRVTTFFDAVFSPSEAVYLNRPDQATPFTNLALAGDWTQTLWPATLEGAVRSGLKAVEALADTPSK